MTVADPARPTALVALFRGLTKRCPRCGEHRLFRRWLKMEPRCPRCGLALEREEGAFLGSLSLNYGVTGAVFMAVLITWVAVQSPHVQWLPLALVSVGVSVVVPFVFYPFAKTIWAAIDFLLQGRDVGPSEPSAPTGTRADRSG